jgi:hypothetical protein
MIQTKSRLEWGIPILYTRAKTSRLFSFVPATAGNDPRSQAEAAPASPRIDAKAALRALYARPQL